MTSLNSHSLFTEKPGLVGNKLSVFFFAILSTFPNLRPCWPLLLCASGDELIFESVYKEEYGSSTPPLPILCLLTMLLSEVVPEMPFASSEN